MTEKTRRDIVVAACKKHPEAPSKTLARGLYKGHYLLFKDLGAAYSAVRQVRGAMGKAHKAAPGVEWEKQKAGWKPKLPPSHNTPWVPVILDIPCKVLALSDPHVPYHCEEAMREAVRVGKAAKPDVLLINGDLVDFHTISRFAKDPYARSVSQEIQAAGECLAWLAKEFPKARKIFKLGNHDERMDKFVWNRAPELFDLDEIQLHSLLKLDATGFERVSEVPIMAGGLAIIHGHEVDGCGQTTPARDVFRKTGRATLQGHVHRTDTFVQKDLLGGLVNSYTTGCLCDLRPRYSRINRWNHGFAVVEAAGSGEVDVHNYRIDGGRAKL